MTPLGFPIVRALGLAGKTAMATEETPFEILSRHDATRCVATRRSSWRRLSARQGFRENFDDRTGDDGACQGRVAEDRHGSARDP